MPQTSHASYSSNTNDIVSSTIELNSAQLQDFYGGLIPPAVRSIPSLPSSLAEPGGVAPSGTVPGPLPARIGDSGRLIGYTGVAGSAFMLPLTEIGMSLTGSPLGIAATVLHLYIDHSAAR